MNLDVFIAYSHADEQMKQELLKHLRPLQRTGLVQTWHDGRILAGADWNREIDEHLNSSDIILLLISSDFIDSNYCYGVEMNRALERHGLDEARVIPVILRPCDWHALPFGRLLGLPQNEKPVTTWRNQDEAYTNIALELRKFVDAAGSKTVGQAEAADSYNVTYRVTSQPRFVAGEGYTERIADLILDLSVDSMLANTALKLTVRIVLNTTITNSLSSEGFSDAVLTTATGAILAYGRVAGNQLTFEQVAVLCPRHRHESTFHIKNLAVNATFVAEPGMITAAVFVEGPTSVRIRRPAAVSAVIAIPAQALAFRVAGPKDGGPSGPSPQSESLLPEKAIAHIHFTERFPGGFHYHSVSPIGTRLKALFTGIPTGTSLWVGTTPIQGPTFANLVPRELGESRPIRGTETIEGVPVIKLPVDRLWYEANEFVSVAVWEVEAPLPSGTRSYEFPVFLRYDAAMSPNPSQIKVYGSLAPNPSGGGFPPGGGTAASATLPVPRYSSSSTKVHPLFQINSKNELQTLEE